MGDANDGCWHGDKGHPCALSEADALRAENAELRKLTAELRQERDEARRERDAARAELSASIMSTQMWMDLEAERDEARRERDAAQNQAAMHERNHDIEVRLHRDTQNVLIDTAHGWGLAERDLAALRRRVEEKDAALLEARKWIAAERPEPLCRDMLAMLDTALASPPAPLVESSKRLDALLESAIVGATAHCDAKPPVAAQGTKACPECGHRHADKTGALGCWACQCGHPANCRCGGCAAQGTREDAKQPDAPGREEER